MAVGEFFIKLEQKLTSPFCSKTINVWSIYIHIWLRNFKNFESAIEIHRRDEGSDTEIGNFMDHEQPKNQFSVDQINHTVITVGNFRTGASLGRYVANYSDIISRHDTIYQFKGTVVVCSTSLILIPAKHCINSKTQMRCIMINLYYIGWIRWFKD